MPIVETNDVQIYYERHGDGEPVVLLHGGFSDHQLWKQQVEALRDEYEVITYDLRGHGHSGGADLSSYPIDLHADDLRALVTALDLDAPHLCGLSLGGMTALTYATRYPDTVATLTVSGTPTPDPQTLKGYVLRGIVHPAAATATGIIGYDRIQSGMWWISERIGGGEEADEVSSKAAELRDEQVELNDEEYTKILKGGATYRHTALVLENISCPTLVLHGKDEPLIPAHLPVYRARIDDVQCREIPDAGHNAHIQNPEAFTDVLRSFISDN